MVQLRSAKKRKFKIFFFFWSLRGHADEWSEGGEGGNVEGRIVDSVSRGNR